MKRSRLPVIAAGVVLLIGALAGATALTSSRTAQQQQELFQTLKAQLEASGYAQVTGSSYQRGLLSSTQTMNIKLGKDAESVNLIITNHIQHGPLPGLKSVGNALIDSEVRFADEAIQGKVDQALGGKKPVIRTVVGLGGDTSSHVDVPQGQFSENGGVITWQPLTADVKISGLNTQTTLSWPEFKAQDKSSALTLSALTLSGLSITGNSRKHSKDDLLGVGEQAVTLKSAAFKDASSAASNLKLADLRIKGSSTLKGGFYGGQVLYDIGQLGFDSPGQGAQNFKNVQLHLSMNHLSQAPLARLVKVLNDLGKSGAAQTGGQAAGLDSLTPAQQQSLTDDAVALLRAQPVFAIDRLSMQQPGGEIVLSGKAELPGAAALTSESARMLSAAPMAALGMLRLQAQFSAAEPALRELLGSVSPGAAGSLDSLIQAGYLKRRGTTLSSELTFDQQGGKINGQALGGF